MNDASNNAYSENLSFSIGLKEGTDDTYILALTVDPEYLNNPERQYPVTIDPTYIWTGGTDVADAYVLNGTTYGDTNFYSSAVTTFSVGDGSQGLYRTYIRFADFLHNLSGYYVDSANLTIYETGSSQANNTIQVHRVTEDWSKTTVTWNNRPGYSTTPITSAVTSGVAGRAKSFDITSYARQVANGTYSSYGIMLRANDESSTGLYSQFYSSRFSNEALRPKLTVIYYDGPTTASSVTLKSSYIKPGATATINWSGINSQSLNMVQYHIYKYNDETATLGDEIIGYSSSTKIGTTSSGSSTIPATASLSEGCYRIYVRGVDNGGIKGAGKGVTLHIDGTAPTISSVKLSPTTAVSNYSNKIPSLTWSGGADSHFSQLEYSINGSAYAKAGSTSGTITLLASSFSAAGVYTVKVRAVDKSGNYSAIKTLSYYYDKNVSDSNKPEITKVQFANTTNVSPDITITSNRPDGTSFTVSKVYYYMVASTSTTEPTDDQYILATNISNNDGKTNFQLNSADTSKGNGVYKLYVKIQDANNNTSGAFLAAYYRMVNVVYDTSVTLSATYNETDNVIALFWNGDSTISSVKLYKRYGEDSFKYGQTINNGTSVNLSTENIEDTTDFRLLVTYLNGSQKTSNVVSILNDTQDNSTDDVEILKYTVTAIDRDGDNIEDAYELWDYNTDSYNDDSDEDGINDDIEIKYLRSNPNLIDSDLDGFSDYYEVLILGTDVNTVTDVNGDKDNDSVTDINEYKNGTNPYLEDTDFDGINDNSDTNPLIIDTTSNLPVDYNINIPIGIYDTIEQTTLKDGSVRKTIYNKYLMQTKEISDNNLKITYIYNSEGKKTAAITYANGKYIYNTYSYEGSNIKSITQNNFHYDFNYDANGNIISAMAGSNLLYTNQYVNDLLTEKLFGNGNKLEYAYDENQNLNKITSNGVNLYEWIFNEEGVKTSYIDHIEDEVYSYDYDSDYRLSKYGNNHYTISYEYNNPKKITYKVNSEVKETTIDNVLNDDESILESTTKLLTGGKLFLQKTDSASYAFNTIYNENNDIVLDTNISLTNGLINKISYNGEKILTYNYDNNNNISAVYENGILIVSYEYDGFGQLIRENLVDSNKTIVYAYDTNGNMLSKEEYNYDNTTRTSELTNKISTVSYNYNDNKWRDLLTNYNGQNITYDSIGNPLSYRNGMNFTWESGKNLSKINKNNDEIYYTYNSDGIRTSKTVNGIKTKYIIDQNSTIIAEETNNKIIWYAYDENGSIIGFQYLGNNYYYEKNIHGDIIEIYNNNGEKIVEYNYDSWGNQTNVTGDLNIASINPFRYASYYYDNETGFYYLQSRYYDPITSRMINADEPSMLLIDQVSPYQYNLFTYCNNNPVMFVDPDGHFIFVCIIVGALVGAVAGGIYAAYKSKQKLGYVNGKWVLGGAVIGGGVGALAGWGVGAALSALGITGASTASGTLGATVYGSWQQAEQQLRNAYGGISKTFSTPMGKRIVDCFSKQVIRESKYGYQGLSQSIQTQINKDVWLLKNTDIKSIEWHFYWSKVSGTGGPSGPLLKELYRQGIKVIFH
jgi:RHS repeat-associated protein